MTLDTKMALHGAINVHELYAYCRALLNTPDNIEPEYGSGWSNEKTKRIGNPCGVGLDAWLTITYGPDGPLPVHEHDKWCETELGGEYNTTQEQIDDHAAWVAGDPTENGWASVEVSFDTAYGHRTDRGESCSALHARLVAEVGHWCDRKGIEWKWQNEYTGEWFDRDDQLAEFGGFHTKPGGADEWFRNIVMPAIAGGLGATS